MPLREDILSPISEALPAGESLRYAPVFDKIKEARRQDDDAPQGEWQHERKVADYSLVIKLASEAIATKSKDLQLAAWLTEALLLREGYAGLHQGLTLILGIVEKFWEGCWPEVDDGDAEMRAAPIDWVGQYLVIAAKRVPVTRNGYDYLKYLDSKAIGLEPGYHESEAKKEAYSTAISDGKLPMEEFEKVVNSTPADFYEKLIGSIDDSLQAMEDSVPVFEEKFGQDAPSYSRLREAVEEVRRIVNQWLQKKIEALGPATPEPEAEEELVEPEAYVSEVYETVSAPVQKQRSRRVTSAEPADKEDAAERVAAAAAFWRKEDPYSPAPYLMLRGMRWGEIRASSVLDPSMFEAPSTETRTTLKRMLSEGSYGEMVEIAESAMAGPCGRAWLDLQRYVVVACENLGYMPVADAIRAELKALIRDYPDLLISSMLDDTPTANRETVSWFEEFGRKEEPAAAPEPEVSWSAPPPMQEPHYEQAAAEESLPDSYQLAMDAMRGGRTEEAFTILADEIGRQNSGRGRFQRKVQLAQICLTTGHEHIAQPLLEELQAAIDRHLLEEWESPDVVAHALSLLYSCAQRTDMDAAARTRLYARICRLSPVQALKYASQALAQGR